MTLALELTMAFAAGFMIGGWLYGRLPKGVYVVRPRAPRR